MPLIPTRRVITVSPEEAARPAWRLFCFSFPPSASC